MKKLLIVIQLLRRGGVELAALNFAFALDKNNYDITFYLVDSYGGDEDESLEHEILSRSMKIIRCPADKKGHYALYCDLKRVMKEGNYDIVHSHVQFSGALVVTAAKMCGVKVRACHSHFSHWNHPETAAFKLYKFLMQKIIVGNGCYLLACSNEAGTYLYGKRVFKKKGIIIKNAVDTERFAYNDDYRNEIRKEFSIDDKTIIVGNIATVYRIKNQLFLVEIFSQMLKRNSDMRLIMVGEEADSLPVHKKIRELNIENKTIFTGVRSDAQKFLSAFDIMIFPSLHEGFPVSLIEAQAAALPCLISDTVTKTVKYNDNVRFESLDNDSEMWADAAMEMLRDDRNNVSVDLLKENFDIKNTASFLDSVYKGKIRGGSLC